MVSVLGDVDPVKVMYLGMEHSHFDEGGRRDRRLVAPAILAEFAANPFLEGLEETAHDTLEHKATATTASTLTVSLQLARLAFFTHHGTRKPGAMLYKHVMQVAERDRNRLSRQTLKQNAWTPVNTKEDVDYWAAYRQSERRPEET